MSEAHAFQPPRRVITIPAQINPVFSTEHVEEMKKRLVAAYARVSTNSEEQKTSYEAQVSYYTEYIQSKEEWILVDVYTDKGITGTSRKNRDGFNRMMEDALAGKINLIITKSVSRFARNTVDSLVAIRQLKEKGVEVFFEEQNISTMDSKGEVLITIMASLAQDESRNISENVTWGQRKRFADGKVTMPYGRFLGYKKGADGNPEIDEDEAWIVRRIYRMFLEGKSAHAIARSLKADEVLTPSKKSANWQAAVVRSILTNERYKGDALLQKSFTMDYLTKKTKKNEGEVPQYYAENSHPAIIEPEVFDHVQTLIANAAGARHASAVSIFSGKLLCADCDEAYGSKVWHSNDQYRRRIWQCNAKFKKADRCKTPHLDDAAIQRAFVSAINHLLEQKVELMAVYRDLLKALTDTTQLEEEADSIQKNHDAIIRQMEISIHLNASTALDQAGYREQYDVLLNQANEAKSEMQRVNSEIVQRKVQRKTLLAFMRELNRREGVLTAFDGDLWVATVASVTVTSQELCFAFKDGSVQQVPLEN